MKNNKNRKAIVYVYGFSGTKQHSCVVIGKNKQNWHVRMDNDALLPTKGLIKAGECVMVPKSSLKFVDID